MRRERSRELGGATVLVALSVAAGSCGGNDGTGPRLTSSATATHESSVVDEIEARYNCDQAIRGHAIDVTVENGVATLRGTVTERARERAVTLARAVTGVSRVNDALEVIASAAASPCDCLDEQRITQRIQAQFFLHPEVRHGTIHVSTTAAGVVRLDGEVGSVAAKDHAVRIAREMPGVSRVDNRLMVESAARSGAGARPGRQPSPRRP